jgi:hypothetical protein
VWWDPRALRLNVEESVGLRQQRLLEVDEEGVSSERGVRAHETWQAERARVRAAAAVPAMTIVTATSWAASGVTTGGGASIGDGVAGAVGGEVTLEAVGDVADRPHGARFGALVHAVLAAADLDADATAIGRVAALHARLLGASERERDAAAAAAERALGHPLLRRAAAAAGAGRCRREVPLALRLEDGTLVEGVADLAFCDDGGWTVIDFKTDVELGSRLAEYRLQLGLYARAVAAATGSPAASVLLRV